MSLWQRIFGTKRRPITADAYGDFEAVERIAAGRLSTLYRGRHAETGEEVAIKVLTDYACRVADKLTRKLGKDWEGSRALRLEHRNVVRTIAAAREHGRYYIVMEYLSGGNFTELIRRDDPAIAGKRIEVIRQAGRGLEYVHKQGIIHRDVCPRNFMLSGYGVAKLIDFGVAAERDDRIRNTGQRTGRPAYMAPELIRTNRFNDQTDIYAFGVSLYEVATGQKPYRVTNEDTFKALSAMLNREPPRPTEIHPSISPRLEALILKAIARRPQDRYRTMAALLEDLEGIDDGDL
jgi:serine/threonine protein kinase